MFSGAYGVRDMPLTIIDLRSATQIMFLRS